MTKLFSTLLVQIRNSGAAATERARPPRRGFELAIHPETRRKTAERPQTGSRSPRNR